jgi:hypothetical protein
MDIEDIEEETKKIRANHICPPNGQRLHALHEEACAQNKDFFVHPDTGCVVMTRVGLLKRKRCCGSGCRFCPYSRQKNKKLSKYKKEDLL